MSQVPIGANVVDGFKAGHGLPTGQQIMGKYGEAMKTLEQFGMDPRLFSQFGGAELLAKKYDMTKEDLDKFSVLSQQRAADATKAGRFNDEIVPLQVRVLKDKGKSVEVLDEMHTK